MIHRPVNAAGDILPVLSSADLIRDAEAVAQLVYDRLSLFEGEWWENPEWGNEIMEILRETRITEQNMDMLGTYLTSYIWETPGVLEVSDVAVSSQGRQFFFSCTVTTEYGSAIIHYEL